MPGPGHVLIVDDELVIRSLLSEMLSEDGFTVATAEDGQRGLEYMNSGDVDLVISDVHMPLMDGPALVSELRKIDPNLPVIVLNSIPDRDLPGPVQKDRAIAFVNKPFDLQEIRRTISRLRPIAEDDPHTATRSPGTQGSDARNHLHRRW